MNPDFSSVWAKFHRAEEHINTFEKEVMAWVSSNPYRVAVKHNADFSRYWAIIRVRNEPSLKRWSLISSDSIHNLRCALDHLIYAIAIVRTKTNPPPRVGGWAFPIRDDFPSFQSALKNHIFHRLGTSVLEEIERFQPYNRLHPRLPPILGMLRRFDDLDKHRLLRVAMVQPRLSGWNWVPHPDLSGRIVPTLSEVVDGAKVGELIFQGPSQDADPKFSANLVISLEPLSGEKPIEVPDMLPEMVREVRTVIECVFSRV